MKLIIAGSRGISDLGVVGRGLALVRAKHNVTEIISGGADGPDKLGETLARNLNIQCTVFRAEWHKFGRRAGMLRNVRMGEYAEGLLAIWDGKSTGTKHMIDYMTRAKKYVAIMKVAPGTTI